MIDWLKSNWKTTLIGGVVFIFVLWCIFGGSSEPAEVAPAVEETPTAEEVLPEEVVE